MKCPDSRVGREGNWNWLLRVLRVPWGGGIFWNSSWLCTSLWIYQKPLDCLFLKGEFYSMWIVSQSDQGDPGIGCAYNSGKTHHESAFLRTEQLFAPTLQHGFFNAPLPRTGQRSFAHSTEFTLHLKVRKPRAVPSYNFLHEQTWSWQIFKLLWLPNSAWQGVVGK